MSPTKILFICHGNICRSPMAEFIMKDLVHQKGFDDLFYIESAATSTEEIGCDIYPPAKRKLKEKGIPFSRRSARQMTRRDYQNFDYIIYMESYNLRNLNYIVKDTEHKMYPLLNDRDVSDPWYTDNFDVAYNDILEGCQKWLEVLTNA